MANFKLALSHHAHAHKALKANDATAAMHHVGHMMAALRSATASIVGNSSSVDDPIDESPAPNGIRGRLAGLKPPVGPATPPTVLAGPTPPKAPSSLRARLAGMGK